MYDRFMNLKTLCTVAAVACLSAVAVAEPLAPVASESGVTVVAQATDIQDEPRIMLARAGDPAPKKSPPVAAPPSPAQASDPFARLKRKVPKDKLPPLKSVRVKNPKDDEGKKGGDITVSIKTSPGGAAVSWGGKSLGVTPFSIAAPRGSTPIDIVIRARGRMTLRTRVMRDISRSYFYKLHPAKIR